MSETGHTPRIARALTCLALCSLFFLLFGLIAVAPSEAALSCTLDAQGADDEPGQKDLTQFCQGAAGDIPGLSCSGVNAFTVRWSWDDTGFSGNNTGDACALFGPSGGNASFALCVTITGDPATQAAQSPRLYSCSAGRADRCTNAVAVSSFASTCSVGVAPDPFGGNHQCHGNGCDGSDAAAACCIQPSDVGANVVILDVCSYPSQQPNSDPSDCIIHTTEPECTTNTDCDDGNPCTVDTCDSGSCHHALAPSTTVCRAAAGVCDAVEHCTGDSDVCPPDIKSTDVCRPAVDVCD